MRQLVYNYGTSILTKLVPYIIIIAEISYMGEFYMSKPLNFDVV